MSAPITRDISSAAKLPAYAELHCLSNFSFLRGASSAKALFERAKACGYDALAITDEASLAGIVRAFEAAKAVDLKLLVGSEVQLTQGPKLVLLAENLAGYQRLCQWLTLARRRSKKGQYRLHQIDFSDTEGVLALWVPLPDCDELNQIHGSWLKNAFPSRAWLAVELHRGTNDAQRLQQLLALGGTLGLPCVASGDVHMHVRGRRALQDTISAIRHRTRVAEAGALLFPNGERHLRSREILAQIYPHDLLTQSVLIAERCSFSLTQLRYQYPNEIAPAGTTLSAWLRELTAQGAHWRWPQGVPEAVQTQLAHELDLITELSYEAYFLTVYDIVRFAREQGILCQGRGSAANSAVCYALGITEVDPACMSMLMERFISRERKEPPDIDVDFDATRREEVIQYVYQRYGRERAALTAVVVTYSGRSTIREVAKALGLAPALVDQLAKTLGRWGDTLPTPEHLQEAGFDLSSAVLKRVLVLTAQLMNFPRHLSQHPGGFLISERPLHTLVPVENAAMPGRSIVQWDKDDLDTLGLLKVDVLGIGMLGAISRCLQMLLSSGRRALTPAAIPAQDPAVYQMIQRADTVGAFQIESRAQMAMLPRLKPANYYDLVIQVAIVRPGPIEGKMVHPYLQRRQGKTPVEYPSAALEKVLARTLGIPLFQEQVMHIAMVAAGYTPGEADQLRRCMAAWKRHGGLEPHRERLLNGMRERGYTDAFAEQIFSQIKGFGSYGFPESHAASYALVVYLSCWLKHYEPAAFTCALINTPTRMGFYTPDQLLQDVRRHGVVVYPIDVRSSDWDCTLEAPNADALADLSRQPAIRIGFNQVRGLAKSSVERLMLARALAPFKHLEDLMYRANLDRRSMDLLAEANALCGLAGHRNRARWAARGVSETLPLFAGLAAPKEAHFPLAPESAHAAMLKDYAINGTSLGPHPLALIRKQLRAKRCRPSGELHSLPHGVNIQHAGLVTLRQRPQTAKGVTFVTLEDEDGSVNVVVWRDLAERQRRELSSALLLMVQGRWESVDGVSHLIAQRLHNISAMLENLSVPSHDYH
jgi:error-prone DNA polymerase